MIAPVLVGDAFLIPPGAYGCTTWVLGDRCGVALQSGHVGALPVEDVARYKLILAHLLREPERFGVPA